MSNKNKEQALPADQSDAIDSDAVIADLQDRVAVLETEAALLLKENEALKAQLAEKPSSGNSAKILPIDKGPIAPASTPAFEVDGKQYRFRVAAFRIGGTKYTAEQAVADPVLLDLVLNKYPGLVTELA